MVEVRTLRKLQKKKKKRNWKLEIWWRRDTRE